jgi:hypothetical protein
MKILLAVVIMLSCLPVFLYSAEVPVKVRVSDRIIMIPCPPGFVEVGENKRDFFPAAPNNRLLAIFVSPQDLPLLDGDAARDIEHYMQVQVSRRAEDRPIGAADFKELVGGVREQQDARWEEIRDKMNTMLSDAAKESKDFPQMEIGKPIPLGTFLNKESAYGFAMLMSLNAGGRPKPIKMVCGACFIKVKERLLFTYVYAKHEGNQSIEWVRRTSQDWVDRVIADNK